MIGYDHDDDLTTRKLANTQFLALLISEKRTYIRESVPHEVQ